MRYATLFAVAVLTLCGCSDKSTSKDAKATQAAPTAAATTQPAETADDSGIEVVWVRRSVNGNILDFRYRVIDPEKGLKLLSKKDKPYLIDQKTGARFMVPSSPKVGPLRQTSLKAEPGRVYWVLFGNSGQAIKAGDKVTVVIGDYRAEDIVVQ